MDLLPCPFCGGAARHGERDTDSIILCQDCSACGPSGNGSSTNATQLWNQRNPPPEPPADALRSYLEDAPVFRHRIRPVKP